MKYINNTQQILQISLLTLMMSAGFSAQANTSNIGQMSNTTVNSKWVGSPVPDFRLQDQSQAWHTPAQYKGKWLIVYFYPKDGTAGCTQEAKQFRDLYPAFQKSNAAVLGISLDDVASHQKFSNELKLPFPILADNQGTLATQFGIVRNLGVIKMAKRESFLIDPKGVIIYHYTSVDSQTHAQQVLADIKKLSK
jgi:peroxiredoxin Q/BCP